MFQNQFQGHGSSTGAISPNQPGNGSGQRVTHQGYSYKSIMENALIPSLEKHIQELEEKTNKQKKEITNLKNLIDLLQTALEKKSKE